MKSSRSAAYFFAAAALMLATACAVTNANRVRAAAPPKRPPFHQAVQSFLRVLTPAQRASMRFAFDAEERLTWYFVPIARKGLTYQAMDDKQRRAALELLTTFLSENGYRKTEAIRARETVLAEIENDTTGSRRNPGLYYFTLFGEPSERGAWGLRYEGHHISLHWTVIDGRIAASSPQFLGVNPARLLSGPRAGNRALAAEEDLGRALALSLTEMQKTKGIAPVAVPREILTTNKRKVAALEDSGIGYADLSKEQRVLLLSIIQEYAGVQAEAVAKKRLDAIRKSGLETVKFLWIGPVEPGKGHYYRVQGKTFLIEYDNTQNNANHVHAVWRDFTGDFGEDALTAHYQKFPPNTKVGHSHGHGQQHQH